MKDLCWSAIFSVLCCKNWAASALHGGIMEGGQGGNGDGKWVSLNGLRVPVHSISRVLAPVSTSPPSGTYPPNVAYWNVCY